jgi:D-alanine-D-alanine ligase
MSRIAFLTGGSTPERDVAFAGAAQVVDALRESGHQVNVVDTVTGPLTDQDETRLLEPAVGKAPPTPDELRALADREKLAELVELAELRDADFVFLVLHGRQGEGGELQALLDSAGLFYTGSDAAASALAMDKDAAKRRFKAAGIPTHPSCLWPAEADTIADLGLPLVVKPSKVGSSVGLSVVRSIDQLGAAVDLAKIYDDAVLLEQFLPGREFTVGVLGDRALAVGEIIPRHELFDYECKYQPGLTDEVFPADVTDDVRDQLQAHTLAAHRALGLRDFSRVDFKEDTNGVPQCLEVNTLPGLTAASLLPKSAAAVGILFGDLCETICTMAVTRSRIGNKDYP